uniref:Carbohydrate sulfotransferase 11 n=1 Tax=Ovis aries TaxID=9940 RepID=A0AC11E155_SHEEP
SSLWRGGRGPVRQPQRPAQRQRRRRRHHHQHHRSHPSRPAREEAAAAAGGSGGGGGGEARRSRGRSNGAQPAGPRISALPEQLRRLPHPCPGLGAPRAAAKPTPILPAILAQPCPAPPGLRSAPRGPRSCAPGAPPGHPGSRSQDKAMKPALLEVMRMNRICRMVLATCLGSFILVIFYFQSMLHPGYYRILSRVTEMRIRSEDLLYGHRLFRWGSLLLEMMTSASGGLTFWPGGHMLWLDSGVD